jgi:hypothetical protein
MCVVFKNELFEVEKRSFVLDFLTDLDDGFPGVQGVCFGTVRTLLVGYDEFAFESLLEDGCGKGFFLNSEFNSDSSRVRFRPDKPGIDETDLIVKLLVDLKVITLFKPLSFFRHNANSSRLSGWALTHPLGCCRYRWWG